MTAADEAPRHNSRTSWPDDREYSRTNVPCGRYYWCIISDYSILMTHQIAHCFYMGNYIKITTCIFSNITLHRNTTNRCCCHTDVTKRRRECDALYAAVHKGYYMHYTLGRMWISVHTWFDNRYELWLRSLQKMSKTPTIIIISTANLLIGWCRR